MAKEFYTNGTGSSQTLNPSDESKIKIYDSKADADLDLANIEENEIIATKAGESEGVETFPIGMISPFGGSTAPVGWLLCDGSAVSRATYAKLYSVIGEAFGSGDGSTTFNLPDLRESVPKGAGLTGNSTNHIDTDGLSVGEFIEDQLQNHVHTIDGVLKVNYGYGTSNNIPTSGGGNYSLPSTSGTSAQVRVTNTNSVSSDYRYGATTEVKSVGVNYIIKY